MQTAKDKVTTAVHEYARLFPEELVAFQKSVAEKAENKATKFAEVKGDVIERHLFDMPEKLYAAIRGLLNDDEFSWLFGHGDYLGNGAGIKWFIETFPTFTITSAY